MIYDLSTSLRPATAFRFRVLGFPVDCLGLAEALAWVDKRVRARGAPALVLAVNANSSWQMSRDARMRQIVAKAALVLPGAAVVWVGRLLGAPRRACIGGVMLLKALLPMADAKGYRLFFLGAAPSVLRAVLLRLLSERPTLQIAGWRHRPVAGQDQTVVEEIHRSRADILIMDIGTPRQEYWLHDNLERLQVPVVMALAGSFDVLAEFRTQGA